MLKEAGLRRGRLMRNIRCRLSIDKHLYQTGVGGCHGFRFNLEGPRYCLVQEKGGPCGVLAAVMAFIVKNMMKANGEDPTTELPKGQLPGAEDLLKDALAEILWRVVEGSSGKIHLVYGLDDPERPDRASVATFDSQAAAVAALGSPQFLRQYAECAGLVAFVYSAILTRGLEEVREDTDDPKGATMLGAHGYCTQELVNLLLVGRAVSNTFDGQQSLDGLVLTGIESASCPVGLLSLYEHFGCLEVGQRLKMPTSSIWLICAESHYSLLYGVGPIDSDTVELRYMDQLMGEEGEYHLTLRLLDRKAPRFKPPRVMTSAATARVGLLRALVSAGNGQMAAEKLPHLYALAGAAIEAMAMEGDISAARQLVARMEADGEASARMTDSRWPAKTDRFPRLPVPLSIYTSLARGLASQKRIADCVRLWGHVTKWRLLKPDNDFFEAMLSCCAAAKDSDLAAKLLTEADVHSVQLGQAARSNALGALAHSRKHGQTAWELYCSIVASAEPIPSITFERVLVACATNRWHHAIPRILQLADKSACPLGEAAIVHAIRAFREPLSSESIPRISAEAAELRMRNAWSVIGEDHKITLRQMNALVEVYCSLGYWQEAVSLVLSARERWPWMGEEAADRATDGEGFANVHTFKPIFIAIKDEPCETFFAVWDVMVLDCSITPTSEMIKEAINNALIHLKSAKRLVQLLELAYSRGIPISQDQLDLLRREASHVRSVQQLIQISSHLKVP
ncbi:hypothetical protein FOL47_008764 [Perkinsus chesapeaki]|uniref:Deubiquitinating enzyme MINDY-3/4 conserved domain-containing protein n=1 Tax=Perkinsus chesapeaki TaxID=330153 RepID=A0A7J6MSY3_PERCH|nr:hypothetical protein FOL47_008764 [Perkinsus chesapeaki]